MQLELNKEIAQVFLFIIGSVFFVLFALRVTKLIRPKRPNSQKLTPYECGEEPTEITWGKVNNRYYIIAIAFILFSVEIIFLFPWATVFGNQKLNLVTHGQWAWFAIIEMFIFVIILAIGLAYIWSKGMLNWLKPKQDINIHVNKTLNKKYANIQNYYKVKKDK